MRPIPKPEPAECPQNPSRRRFLRTAFLAGVAFAAGCKPKVSDSQTSARIFRNRPFPLGNTSVSFKGCSNTEQTATFEVSRPAGLPDSITLSIPGSFSIPGPGSKHEIYVEGISCNTDPPSAEVSISTESAPLENAQNTPRLFADLPAIVAAIAFFGAVAFWITHRRKPEEKGGALLGPRNGKTTTI
ncbi:MAG: hypothetical protein PHQ80_03640 [Candidatus ainarchaeum sp.]|nr:hypothetical protein [Candidatus ainarchaeum sp.]MDD5096201.1 hypothetical protein [Candidatus ainarchaeum sp.]